MNTKVLFPLLHINFSTQVSFTNPYKNPKKRNGETALGIYLNWQCLTSMYQEPPSHINKTQWYRSIIQHREGEDLP